MAVQDLSMEDSRRSQEAELGDSSRAFMLKHERPPMVMIPPKFLTDSAGFLNGPPSPSTSSLSPTSPFRACSFHLPSEASSIPEALSPVRSLRFQKEEVWSRHWRTGSSDGSSMESMRLTQEDVGKYTVGELLGEGSFAKVYKVQCKETGETFALKQLLAKDESNNSDVLSEIGNAIEFDHPYVLKMHGFWQAGPMTYNLVMDLCTGGDLRSFAIEHISRHMKANPRWDSGLETRTAARFAFQMLNGLVFLHHWGFIHRDIKPENYLLLHGGPNAPLKLADFGFTCRLDKGEKLNRCVGSPMYAAPEVLQRSYDQKADLWSVGVTCFGLCTNSLPFQGVDAIDYLESVKAGAFVDDEKAWRPQMPRLRSLVSLLMTRDPEARPSAKNVLAENTWLRRFGKPEEQQRCCAIS